MESKQPTNIPSAIPNEDPNELDANSSDNQVIFTSFN